MHEVVFKNYREKLMKFVNKLSVISLIVLMFSFMNIASAFNSGDCTGDAVSTCAESKTQSACGGTFRPASPTKYCVWDSSTSICRATGSSCYGPVCSYDKGCPDRYSCTNYRSSGVTVCRAML